MVVATTSASSSAAIFVDPKENIVVEREAMFLFMLLLRVDDNRWMDKTIFVAVDLSVDFSVDFIVRIEIVPLEFVVRKGERVKTTKRRSLWLTRNDTRLGFVLHVDVHVQVDVQFCIIATVRRLAVRTRSKEPIS